MCSLSPPQLSKHGCCIHGQGGSCSPASGISHPLHQVLCTSPEAAHTLHATSSIMSLHKRGRDGRGPSALLLLHGLLLSAGKECALGRCPRDSVLEEGLAHHHPPNQRAIFASLLHPHSVIHAGDSILCSTGHS